MNLLRAILTPFPAEDNLLNDRSGSEEREEGQAAYDENNTDGPGYKGRCMVGRVPKLAGTAIFRAEGASNGEHGDCRYGNATTGMTRLPETR